MLHIIITHINKVKLSKLNIVHNKMDIRKILNSFFFFANLIRQIFSRHNKQQQSYICSFCLIFILQADFFYNTI